MSSARTEAPPPVVDSSDELAVFHRALAELCRADMPLPKAFRMLQGDLREGRFKRTVQEMAAEVESGVPLGEAYARRRDAFPPLYCALMEIGMVSGDLPGVLEEISVHAARQAEVAGRIRKALAYPLLAGGFVIVLGAGLLTLIGPRLWSMPGALSLRSPVVVAQAAIATLAVLLVAALLVGWRRGTGFPVLGRLRQHAARASLAATLGVLLRREVPLGTALSLASKTCGKRLAGSVAAATERARAGTGLGEALREERLFDPTLVWLVEAAEETGDAPRALDDVADIYRRRLDRAVDRVTTLVTPLAEILIGAVVFICAYCFTLPLYEYAVGLFRF